VKQSSTQMIPWHQNQWAQLSQMSQQGRVPHALLLVFATQLGQNILCSVKNDLVSSCQECSSCEWFAMQTHPDFLILEPEEGKKLISVDAIRAAIKKTTQTSHQSGYRVLLIHPADAMTTEAANSLLKTLEEPPAMTLLMLLTDKPNRLLPTIRSRTTRIKFSEPDYDVALHWMVNLGLSRKAAEQALVLSHNAPLRFSQNVEELDALILQAQQWWQAWQALVQHGISPVQAAKEWKLAEPSLFLTWMEGLFNAMIKLKALSSHESLVSTLYPNLSEYCQEISYFKLFAARDRVLILMQKLHTSLNWGLQLESLAIECQTLKR